MTDTRSGVGAEPEWHGWSTVIGTAIHIGRLPGRRSVVLYLHEGTTIYPLAYFTSVENAEKALRTLDKFLITPSTVSA